MRNFKVGIIGCGTIFPMHAQSLMNTRGVKLAAVCDIKKGRAAGQARKFRCNHYTNYKVMLSRERLDAVHICTPHYLHLPMVLEAAKRKINILVEKPMALNPREAEKEIKAARKNNVTLSVKSQNRFNPGSQLVKKRIEDKSLGKFKAARLILSYHKPDSFYRSSDWKGRLSKEGGGVVIDQAIHYLDILRWLIPSPIDYVEASCHNRGHSFIDVEDCAEGVIRFKNGFYVSFYLMNYYSYDADTRIEIDCEKARVHIVKDSAYIGYYKIRKDREKEGFIREGREKEGFIRGGREKEGVIREEKAQPRDDEYIDYGDGVKDYWGFCHFNQIKDFYEALRSGRKPAIAGEDALKTQELVNAIYESSKRGRKVYL